MAKQRFRRHADGSTSMVMADGLMNVVANLGTSRDKAAGSYYSFPIVNLQEIINAYRGGWLPRKIVDIPALDATRAWRDWQAKQEQIDKIEAAEKWHRLQFKVKDALTRARLTGGSAIYIGTGDSDLEKPLEVERIGKGGLKYVTVLSRNDLAPGPIERDVTSEWFNKPSFYTLELGKANIAKGAEQSLQIHPSRLVLFQGVPPADEGYVGSLQGWGEPVLLSIMQAVKNMDATTANVAGLVFEAKVDTIGIPNLMANIADPEYAAQLQKRMIVAETSKGINGTLIHDTDEELGQKTANFGALPDIMDRMMQLASGAADIPATRLLGQSPAGMNATGESDLRNYYDRIASMQSLDVAPAMHRLDECLIRSALGNRPPELHFVWAPLWQTSEMEKSTIASNIAGAIQKLEQTGLIPEEPLGKAVINTLAELGIMPGLDAEVARYHEENPQGETQTGPTPEEIAAMLPGGKTLPPPGQQNQNDMEPQTLYVSRKVVNASEILAWAKSQGFKHTLAADDLHVTIAFSRAPVDWMKAGEPWSAQIEIPAGGPRAVERFGDAVVLAFSSREVAWRHEDIKEIGATWDHPEYQPHITISYDPKSPTLSQITPYQGRIVLGPEIFAPVNEDWKASVQEEA